MSVEGKEGQKRCVHVLYNVLLCFVVAYIISFIYIWTCICCKCSYVHVGHNLIIIFMTNTM